MQVGQSKMYNVAYMSATKDIVSHTLNALNGSDSNERFTARAMFGEYALYCTVRALPPKVVALICDDTLFVKILPVSAELEAVCEKGPPFPGAKDHYVVEESEVHRVKGLANILYRIAEARPTKKKRAVY
jgi:hypothetical protein